VNIRKPANTAAARTVFRMNELFQRCCMGIASSLIVLDGVVNLTLQHAARLDRQIIQRHLQFRNGRAELWMFPDLLLQGLQNLVGAGNMRCCLLRILLGLRFARCWHGPSPPLRLTPYFSDARANLVVGGQAPALAKI